MIFSGLFWELLASFELTFSFLNPWQAVLKQKLCILFLKKVFDMRDLMVQHLSSCVTWRCWQITLLTPPVLVTLLSLSLSITLRFPPCLSLKILIWLLASKVNDELTKRLKFIVKGFKTVSKGFSILLEKFGCGCTQQSWRQWNKGEQIFHYFAFNFMSS